MLSKIKEILFNRKNWKGSCKYEKAINSAYVSEKKKGLINQSSIICKAITKVFPLIPQFSKILDIGCDQGCNVFELRKQGHLAWGIDDHYKFVYNDKYIMPFDFKNNLQFELFDFAISPETSLFSLVFSLGVTEYIDNEHSDAYLHNLCRASETILISAPPDKLKFNHADFKNKDWWTDKMREHCYARRFTLETQFADYLHQLSKRPEITDLAERIMIFKAIRFAGRNF